MWDLFYFLCELSHGLCFCNFLCFPPQSCVDAPHLQGPDSPTSVPSASSSFSMLSGISAWEHLTFQDSTQSYNSLTTSTRAQYFAGSTTECWSTKRDESNSPTCDLDAFEKCNKVSEFAVDSTVLYKVIGSSYGSYTVMTVNWRKWLVFFCVIQFWRRLNFYCFLQLIICTANYMTNVLVRNYCYPLPLYFFSCFLYATCFADLYTSAATASSLLLC